MHKENVLLYVSFGFLVSKIELQKDQLETLRENLFANPSR